MLQAAERDGERVADSRKRKRRTVDPEGKDESNEPKLGARIFNDTQQRRLKQVFQENQYPSRMELNELSDEFGTPLGKVKTWFNNQRAKARRMHGEYAPNLDEDVADASSKTQEGPEMGSPITQPSTIDATKLVRPRREQHEKSPLPSSLRAVSLTVGSWACEGFEDELKGDGLEVKILYGRRRFVYEFYIGDNIVEALERGGPYCKVEVLFDNIDKISFVETPQSGFDIELKDEPDCYIQPVSNFAPYAARKKQRLYLRCMDVHELEVFPRTLKHKIRMKLSKAAYIRDKLSQLEPRFRRMMTVEQGTPGRTGSHAEGPQISETHEERIIECVTPPSPDVTASSLTDRTSIIARVKAGKRPQRANEDGYMGKAEAHTSQSQAPAPTKARRSLAFADTKGTKGDNASEMTLPPLQEKPQDDSEAAKADKRLPLLPPLRPSAYQSDSQSTQRLGPISCILRRPLGELRSDENVQRGSSGFEARLEQRNVRRLPPPLI
mmetsp:Transcript_5840/g.17489  ORF Transcript_5840/g.17489 Transcript_5840/m.17489 type:complete len:496 (-) Transcript_5840:1369-2856(-)